MDTPIIVKTDIDAKDGQNKCSKCGSTDISLNTQNGMLRCNFCRYEFALEKAIGIDEDVHRLEGQVIGSGAQDIASDSEDVLTFECSSCGAEVVIDTREVSQARCHWCRNILSVNQQIPNGSIPDMVLPFKITKEDAKIEIAKFVNKRQFFAHPKFKEEFTVQNVMGVYFPYMVIDVNGHTHLRGKGESLVRRYTRGDGENQKMYYDADLYDIEREFDLLIDDLTVESNADRLRNKDDKTNNIINSVMPFDTEQCVRWNANYLRGYSSEKRDINIEQLGNIVTEQSKDIARHKANQTLKKYDRGVCWSDEQLDIKGQKWNTSYLPVWLYSYQHTGSGERKVLHYVAVNARTKKTMGSVPIHMPKLLSISFLVEILGIVAMLFVDFDYSWLFLLSGILFFCLFSAKYRNASARHRHESDTKAQIENIQTRDQLIEHKSGLTNSTMNGANNQSIRGVRK